MLAQTGEHAIAIARAAKRLNDLRERWLNPPEWTEWVPEVIPLGCEPVPGSHLAARKSRRGCRR